MVSGMTSSSQIDTRPVPLSTSAEDVAGLRVLRIRGELDAFTAPSLRDDLRRELVAGASVLALDLSELEFLGVAGLNVLVEMQELADEVGAEMLLVGSPSPLVARPLGLLGWPVTTLTGPSLDEEPR